MARRGKDEGLVVAVYRYRLALLGVFFLAGVFVLVWVPLKSEASVEAAAAGNGVEQERVLVGSQQAVALRTMLDASNEDDTPSNVGQAKRKAPKSALEACSKYYGEAGSRPGVPCLPPAKSEPYSTNTPWRVALGRRIVAAATPSLTAEDCVGVELSPHATFCRRAYANGKATGFSFGGIEDRDSWSEHVSRLFKLRTELFECSMMSANSPLLVGRGVVNGSTRGCEAGSRHPCYEKPYIFHRRCLSVRGVGGGFATMQQALQKQRRSSAHVKLDVNGLEWAVLVQLLRSPGTLEKIRTMDVQLHFSDATTGKTGVVNRNTLERRVSILEHLLAHFWVVGSSLEADREAWQPDLDCAKASCPEPTVHLERGMSLDQFSLSLVSKILLPMADFAEPTEAAEGEVAEAEAEGEGPEPAGPEEDAAAAAAEDGAAAVRLPPPERRPSVAEIVAKATAEDCQPATHSASSRPGIPCVPPLEDGKKPWLTETPWRIALGERVVAAVSAEALTKQDCEGFELFGDSTWCLKAMRGKDVLALSYGIEERDMWSEKMSNVFKMPTRLYDCFIPPSRSPPMAGTAPNGTKKCDHHPGHCYETPYQSFRTCLGPENKKIHGRQYENLLKHLEGHRPLSLHVKIDSEGTEWAILKQLLDRPEELDKIRTLEMEVHFSYVPEGDDEEARRQDERQRLTDRVVILERLLERFYCTGSTLEVYREERENPRICPRERCGEANLHTPRGMSLDQFAVSYVHKGLVTATGYPPMTADELANAREALEAAAAPAVAPRASRPAPPEEEPEPAEPLADTDDPEECVKKYRDQSSRPGRPCMPRPRQSPYLKETPWRVELGNRVLKAVEGEVTEEECDGFELFGDHTWCLGAMRKAGVRGLSYGIEERDLWSEKMSNVFHMPTQLYDCFIPPARSPPIAGTAPNGTRSCEGYGGHCYETPYEPYRICLGPEETRINGRKYETLTQHLEGYPPLSLHLKIDSEGTEWAVLQQLLDSPEDLDKIRTLEMEVHFSYVPEGDTLAAKKSAERLRLEQRTEIMERLRERFLCTGTNLEVYGESWKAEVECPGNRCMEPALYYTHGMSLNQFAVSYVHRRLVPAASARIGPVNGVKIVGGDVPRVGPRRRPPAGGAADALEAEEAAPARPAASATATSRRRKKAAAAEEAAEEPAAPAKALAVWPPEDRPCKAVFHSGSSRPGVPCMPQAKSKPYKTNTKWRAELGERVLAAVVGTVTEEQCDGFELFGDHVWCLKVFRQKGVMGFSYGIEERDLWSEKMSNVFHMYTRLYDCFIPPKQSPPIARTAPNGTGSCASVPGHCYETPYDSYRICLGPEDKTIAGRRYTTLERHLRKRPKLSTHLKIDTEGTEWAILDRLLDEPQELDKIRTLEMEVHFSYVPEGDDPQARAMEERERLGKRVQIMERLLERFACTGTNLEVYRESWHPEKECKNARCDEPAVHLYMGMSVDQFAVSYVNRDLL